MNVKRRRKVSDAEIKPSQYVEIPRDRISDASLGDYTGKLKTTVETCPYCDVQLLVQLSARICALHNF